MIHEARYACSGDLSIPGEVLVSCIDRGTHKLKGVPDLWQIHAPARLLSAPVVTADRKIRSYRHVHSVW